MTTTLQSAPVRTFELSAPQSVIGNVVSELVRRTGGSAASYPNLHVKQDLKYSINAVSNISPQGFWGCRLQIHCPAGIHLRVDKHKTKNEFNVSVHSRAGQLAAWSESNVSSETELIQEIVAAILEA